MQKDIKITSDSIAEFTLHIREGLSRGNQKVIPSMYLYDDMGSALFEVITLLDEYGLTRAEERLLKKHALDIVEKLPSGIVVAELGSGNGKKTQTILNTICQSQPTMYYPIDISKAALLRCQQELSHIPNLKTIPIVQDYLEGLKQVSKYRPKNTHLFVLFLGSSIGNFPHPLSDQFLTDIRNLLQPGDHLLLSTDLEKEIETMVAAYDDELGVTAAFNRNILARINRELDANFILAQFRHTIRYNEEQRRIETYLVSLIDQEIFINKANINLSLRKGESILTEISQKYLLEEIPLLAQRSGFQCVKQWVDHDWAFAENLLVVV